MLSLWHWLTEAWRFMVKVHDRSLIHATAEEVKMQMVSVEVKAVWESNAGRAVDGWYQPFISIALVSNTLSLRWKWLGLSRWLLAFLYLCFFQQYPGRSVRNQGPVVTGRLQTRPGRWLQTVADFPGWEKAQSALAALLASLHFSTVLLNHLMWSQLLLPHLDSSGISPNSLLLKWWMHFGSWSLTDLC